MNEFIHTLHKLDDPSALPSLESGKVLHLPEHYYQSDCLNDALFSENILDGRHKNISYDIQKKRLGGIKNKDLESQLQPLMEGYALYARELVARLCPMYSDKLVWGRTSYRPAEIKGRVSSKRKDDTRLHVDSFAASPVNGLRILRVFCNVNPWGKPRVWHLGEPFEEVMHQFADKIPKYNPFFAKLLKYFKATKTLRSPYDHYQLQLHDRMKLNDDYQRTVSKKKVEFSAQSTWLVFTDHVSHAALGGQFLLEQTFYLNADSMLEPALSPLHHWKLRKGF